VPAADPAARSPARGGDARAGKGIKVVSAMLHHSSHKITGDLYASVLPELAAEAPEAVASMIPRKRATGSCGCDGRGWDRVHLAPGMAPTTCSRRSNYFF
jgi:hypothetical protein